MKMALELKEKVLLEAVPLEIASLEPVTLTIATVLQAGLEFLK